METADVGGGGAVDGVEGTGVVEANGSESEEGEACGYL